MHILDHFEQRKAYAVMVNNSTNIN